MLFFTKCEEIANLVHVHDIKPQPAKAKAWAIVGELLMAITVKKDRISNIAAITIRTRFMIVTPRAK
jgi:hypothetical protein